MNGEIDREEGEVSDWESDVADTSLEKTSEIAILDGEDLESLKKLAGDLGIQMQISKNDLHELYMDFGITSESKRYFRFDAVCVKGDIDFGEKQILEYLQECKPCSAYVINNSACVVVFENRLYATLSLLKFSTSVCNAMDEEADLEKFSHCRRIYIPKCGFFAIRFAKVTENFVIKDVSFNADVYQQLERNYATVQSRLFSKDKNDDGSKNPWGDLCKRWGVYDHQEVYGPELPPNRINNKTAIESDCNYPSKDFQSVMSNKPVAERLGKRILVSDSDESHSDDDDDNDEHWTKKSKHPRMRMRADDEQEKRKQKSNARYQLIIERIDAVNDSDEISEECNDEVERSDIYSRLGVRERINEHEVSINEDSCSDSSSESDDDSYQKSSAVVSQIQKVHSDNDKSSNVWSRLDKHDSSKVNCETDLRTRLTKSKIIDTQSKSDLRKRLDNRKDTRRSPLRIEIDNDYCS